MQFSAVPKDQLWYGVPLLQRETEVCFADVTSAYPSFISRCEHKEHSLGNWIRVFESNFIREAKSCLVVYLKYFTFSHCPLF